MYRAELVSRRIAVYMIKNVDGKKNIIMSRLTVRDIRNSYVLSFLFKLLLKMRVGTRDTAAYTRLYVIH